MILKKREFGYAGKLGVSRQPAKTLVPDSRKEGFIMATVFMKWLEKSPKDYDRGINILTLGQIQRVKNGIVDVYVRPGIRVLEIGCGTGTLTVMMAAKGATVTGIDTSPVMLSESEKKSR